MKHERKQELYLLIEKCSGAIALVLVSLFVILGWAMS